MGGAHKTSVPVVVVAFACGLLLGVGVAFGGMTDGRKTSSFFNVTNIGTAFWDPSLAIMFAVAVLTNAAVYYPMKAVLSKPLFAPEFSIPCRKDTPRELFLGSAMFGAGWALGGYCPGPAVVAAWEGKPNTLAFLVAMVLGMTAFKHYSNAATAKAAAADSATAKASPKLPTHVLAVAGTLALAAVLFVYFEAAASGHSAHVARNTFYVHPVRPAVGGVLAGLAVAIMMALTGEVLGISGIVSGLFSSTTSDKVFRLAFAAGLLAAGALMWETQPDAIVNRLHRPWWFFVVGGFMVGFGTGLGSGCTSGHGVAGLVRLSKRSIIAVAMFMAANFAVTTALQTVGIGTGWKLAMAAAQF